MISIDANVASVLQNSFSNTATSPSYSTVQAGELILAFGCGLGANNTIGITNGTGLAWTTIVSDNTNSGTYIWATWAGTALTNDTVTITSSSSFVIPGVAVISLKGTVDGSSNVLSAIGSSNSATSASIVLNVSGVNSLMFGLGTTVSSHTLPTTNAGQSIIASSTNAVLNGEYWVQDQDSANSSGTGTVTVGDSAGACNEFLAVEVLASSAVTNRIGNEYRYIKVGNGMGRSEGAT